MRIMIEEPTEPDVLSALKHNRKTSITRRPMNWSVSPDAETGYVATRYEWDSYTHDWSRTGEQIVASSLADMRRKLILEKYVTVGVRQDPASGVIENWAV